jgi:hypothetical protein
MNEQQASIQELHHIKQMMERSSRFISLSGLSGISAGFFAMLGAWLGVKKISLYAHEKSIDYDTLVTQLIIIAGCVLVAAFVSAFIFTYLRSKRNGISIWGATTNRLLINLAIPLIAGAFFVLRIVQMKHIFFIAPTCLLFYGLSLINASKYTLGEIRYLGYCELLLGIINLWVPGYGLVFWAVGFGALHVVYGIIMWWKYERV